MGASERRREGGGGIYLRNRIRGHQPERLSLHPFKENEHRLELTGRHGWTTRVDIPRLVPLFGQLGSLSQVGLDVRRHVGSDSMLDVDLGRREGGEVLVVAKGRRDRVEGKQSDQPSSVFGRNLEEEKDGGENSHPKGPLDQLLQVVRHLPSLLFDEPRRRSSSRTRARREPLPKLLHLQDEHEVLLTIAAL